MSIQYSTGHRTNNVADIATALGGTAYLLIYSNSGGVPSSCSAAALGTLLVSIPCNATPGTASGGILTMNGTATATACSPSNPLTANAVANGTAGYWRLCTSSAGTTVIAQGTVSTAGGDLNFASGTTFSSGQTINVTAFTVTATGA
jgi:hypothetical protein